MSDFDRLCPIFVMKFGLPLSYSFKEQITRSRKNKKHIGIPKNRAYPFFFADAQSYSYRDRRIYSLTFS